MEIIKTVQDFIIKFNKEIKTLQKIQVEMEMELKHPITHLENTNESLTSRLNQAESRISDIKDKVEVRDQLDKEYEKNKLQERNTQEMWDIMRKPLNYRTL